MEVNSETDFVARNSKFQEFVGKALATALEQARSGDAGIGAGVGAGGGDATSTVHALDVQHLLKAGPPGVYTNVTPLPVMYYECNGTAIEGLAVSLAWGEQINLKHPEGSTDTRLYSPKNNGG